MKLRRERAISSPEVGLFPFLFGLFPFFFTEYSSSLGSWDNFCACSTAYLSIPELFHAPNCFFVFTFFHLLVLDVISCAANISESDFPPGFPLSRGPTFFFSRWSSFKTGSLVS